MLTGRAGMICGGRWLTVLEAAEHLKKRGAKVQCLGDNE